VRAVLTRAPGVTRAPGATSSFFTLDIANPFVRTTTIYPKIVSKKTGGDLLWSPSLPAAPAASAGRKPVCPSRWTARIAKWQRLR